MRDQTGVWDTAKQKADTQYPADSYSDSRLIAGRFYKQSCSVIGLFFEHDGNFGGDSGQHTFTPLIQHMN